MTVKNLFIQWTTNNSKLLWVQQLVHTITQVSSWYMQVSSWYTEVNNKGASESEHVSTATSIGLQQTTELRHPLWSLGITPQGVSLKVSYIPGHSNLSITGVGMISIIGVLPVLNRLWLYCLGYSELWWAVFALYTCTVPGKRPFAQMLSTLSPVSSCNKQHIHCVINHMIVTCCSCDACNSILLYMYSMLMSYSDDFWFFSLGVARVGSLKGIYITIIKVMKTRRYMYFH